MGVASGVHGGRTTERGSVRSVHERSGRGSCARSHGRRVRAGVACAGRWAPCCGLWASLPPAGDLLQLRALRNLTAVGIRRWGGSNGPSAGLRHQERWQRCGATSGVKVLRGHRCSSGGMGQGSAPAQEQARTPANPALRAMWSTAIAAACVRLPRPFLASDRLPVCPPCPRALSRSCAPVLLSLSNPL